MFRNYLKSSYRHFLNHKINYVFKFTGLTAALFCFLVILSYVAFQLSFDTFHSDYKNIYRVNSIRNEDGNLENFATVPSALGPAMKAQFPEINGFVRLTEPRRALIKYNDKLLRVNGFVEADSTLFSIFSFKFIQGGPKALYGRSNIVITQSLAKQLFGNEDPLQKAITFPERNNVSLQIAGVIADLQGNTHLNINAVMNLGALNNNSEPFKESWKISWDGSVALYLKLSDEAKSEELPAKVKPLLVKNIPPTENGSEKDFKLSLQPVAKIYMDPVFKMEFTKKGNPLHLYFFGLLGVLLILIATINYYSLSIADFDTRNKEIGIRKVLGAEKMHIAFQVVFETTLMFFFSFVISITLLYLFFPQILSLLEPNLQLSFLLEPAILLSIFATLVALVLIAAAYPAQQLTNKNTSFYLKNGQIGTKKFALGNVLLGFQFVISIICISSTLIMARQIDFLHTKDVGFEKKSVITLVMPEQYPDEKVSVLKNELGRLSGVQDLSYSYYFITGVPYFSDWYRVELNGTMKPVHLNEIFVDHNFFSTMNITLMAGRNFDINNTSDSKTAFILNETAVKKLNLTDPIGKKIGYGYEASADSEGTIIGVVKDFNTRPLYNIVEPLVIRLPYDAWPGSCLNIKIGKPVADILPQIKATYEKVLPNYLIDYRLVEEMYNKQYDGERKAFSTLKIGTWITVIISSFGIFSMSLYMSFRRLKEFGIRKVLGASTGQIAFLQISQFFKIAIVSNLIAIPISFIMTKKWLDTFAYHIFPDALIFVGVIATSFLLVLLSAGYSSWTASRNNPVDTLKSS